LVAPVAFPKETGGKTKKDLMFQEDGKGQYPKQYLNVYRNSSRNQSITRSASCPAIRTGPAPAPAAQDPWCCGFENARRCADYDRSFAEAVRASDTWQYVERELKKAAAGNDTSQISVALQMALQLERIEYK
jgi:hypothetical protein